MGPKKTKFIKYPLIAFFAPQVQQNLAWKRDIQSTFRRLNLPSKQLQQNLPATVADLEAGNSKFLSHA